MKRRLTNEEFYENNLREAIRTSRKEGKVDEFLNLLQEFREGMSVPKNQRLAKLEKMVSELSVQMQNLTNVLAQTRRISTPKRANENPLGMRLGSPTG